LKHKESILAGFQNELTIMISGRKTRSVFDCYDVVLKNDLNDENIMHQHFKEEQDKQLS
jgi:hypothetical protein